MHLSQITYFAHNNSELYEKELIEFVSNPELVDKAFLPLEGGRAPLCTASARAR